MTISFLWQLLFQELFDRSRVLRETEHWVHEAMKSWGRTGSPQRRHGEVRNIRSCSLPTLQLPIGQSKDFGPAQSQRGRALHIYIAKSVGRGDFNAISLPQKVFNFLLTKYSILELPIKQSRNGFVSHAYDSTWLRCDFCIAQQRSTELLLFLLFSH